MPKIQHSLYVLTLTILTLCFAYLALPAVSWATSVNTPNASESGSGTVKDLSRDSFLLFGDMLSAGQDVNISNPEVPSNLIAAAQNINVIGGKVGADALLAGASVELDKTTIANNVFAAGETVDSNAVAGGAINAVGKTVRLGGQASAAAAAGETVIIDGAFAGDVSISANTVSIGPDAVVKGTLFIEASEAPEIPASADIADYEFTQGSSGTEEAGAGLVALLAGLHMFFMLTGIVGLILFAVLLLLFATDRPFIAAGDALRTRPARILLTGLVVIILMPLAICILFAIAIGWRVAIAILLVCGVLSMICNAFSALAIGFIAFKKMNRWGAGVLMALIFGVVGAIPILGMLLGLFCNLFVVGYVCTSYYDWRKGRKVQSQQISASQVNAEEPVWPKPEAPQAD